LVRLRRTKFVSVTFVCQSPGRVFDGPFSAVPVEDEEHRLWVEHYIADNPASRPWRYSSADAEFTFIRRLSEG
jgi:hypothetical protein